MTTLMKMLLVAAVLGLPFMLTACNTTEGVGRDVQDVGAGIEDVAEDTGDAIDEEF